MIRRRVLVAVVAVLAGALGLTGCAGLPTTAAVADGQTITQAQIDRAAPALAQYFGPYDSSGTNWSQLALSWRIAGLVMEKGAGNLGVSITDAQREQWAQANIASPTGSYYPYFQAWEDTRSQAVLRVWIDQYLIQTATGSSFDSTSFLASLADIPVTVNPRYGTWDATQLAVVSPAGVPAGVLADPVPVTTGA